MFSLKFHVITILLNGESQFIQYSHRLVESRQEAQRGETASRHFQEQNWELKNVGENTMLQLRETWFQFLLTLLWDLGQFVWPLLPQSPCLRSKNSISFLGPLRTRWALHSSYFRVWCPEWMLNTAIHLLVGTHSKTLNNCLMLEIAKHTSDTFS